MSRAVSEVQIIEETSAEGYQTNRAVEHTNKNDLPRKQSSRDLPQSDDEVLVSNPNKTGTNSYDIPKPASVNETPNQLPGNDFIDIEDEGSLYSPPGKSMDSNDAADNNVRSVTEKVKAEKNVISNDGTFRQETDQTVYN